MEVMSSRDIKGYFFPSPRIVSGHNFFTMEIGQLAS